jgi:two-component system, response regulator PdtaR
MIFGKKERAIQFILVVEDEPLVAFDNEYLLKDAGYEVVGTTDSAEEAQRMIAEAESLDLVMADIGLTDGSGIEVAEAARERGVAVLFVTGNCPGEHRHLAVGCLSKPFSSKVLKNALDAVDTVMRGEEVKKVPDQLTIFGLEGA